MIRDFGPTKKTMVWERSAHENDRKTKYGGDEGTTIRDVMGMGPSTPANCWPKGVKVALNFVINFEEGGERCLLHGDGESESLLSDIAGAVPLEGQRNINMESLYDYGSRAGFWRLHRLFTKRKTPVTVFAVGMALERNPAVCHALKEQTDWEVASHGYRWIDYQNVDEATEREHINRTVQIHERLIGRRPVGFYQGKPNENTRRLVVEEGGFKYDSDSYSDDLPYWNLDYNGRLHLVVPYTLTENDMRFTAPNGYANGEEFSRDLKECLRFLVEEGRAGAPKMMTVGLHCRLARPGRAAAIAEFLEFARSYGREVWICTREQIADHWMEHHFPKGAGNPMSSEPGQQVAELDMKRSGWSDVQARTNSAEINMQGEEAVKEEDGDII